MVDSDFLKKELNSTDLWAGISKFLKITPFSENSPSYSSSLRRNELELEVGHSDTGRRPNTLHMIQTIKPVKKNHARMSTPHKSAYLPVDRYFWAHCAQWAQWAAPCINNLLIMHGTTLQPPLIVSRIAVNINSISYNKFSMSSLNFTIIFWYFKVFTLIASSLRAMSWQWAWKL